MTESSTPAQRARAVWHAADAGVLSTVSVAVAGYPFGSVTPYVTQPNGDPVLLVSGIAQHTKNMLADPRVCLTVSQSAAGDKQAQARVSVLGDAAPVPAEALPAVERRYFAFFPDSRRHFQAHDFAFWSIRPRRVRFIAGFGDIHWLEPEAWSGPEAAWAADEVGILTHMNQDHTEALRVMGAHFLGTSGEVELVAVSPFGFHVRSDQGVDHLPFQTPCHTSESVRAEAVRLTQVARAGTQAR